MIVASAFFRDRIHVNACLIVLCFISVLALGSQSAASYSTYLLALVMLLTIRRWNDVLGVRFSWIVVLLLSYLVVSSFWSDPSDVRGAVSMATRAFLILCFVVSFAECQLRGQLQNWLGRALAIVGTAAAVAALVYYVIDPPADGRIKGLGQLRNQVVAALVFGVVLIFTLEAVRRDSSRRWRLFAIFSGLCAASVIALSDSRNAWFSVVVGLGIFWLTHQVQDSQRFLAGVTTLVLILGVVILALVLGDETRAVVLPRGLSFRPEIWSAAIEKTFAYGPWFGAGILTEDDLYVNGAQFLHPHSMYVSLFLQGGLVALGLFGVLLVWMFRILLLHYQNADAKLALAILGIAIPAYILDGNELVDKVGWTWFLFWVPVAIALGLAWREPQDRYP